MDRRLAVAILIFINVLWGSSYGITKVVLAEIPPVLFGALRWIIGAFYCGRFSFGCGTDSRRAANQRWRASLLKTGCA